MKTNYQSMSNAETIEARILSALNLLRRLQLVHGQLLVVIIITK